jgi:RNA polymerase sigma factor (sigma-70 family)
MQEFASFTVEEDRALVAACAEGDAGAQTQLYERFNRLVYKAVSSTCFRLDAQHVEVQDMVSNVFEKLLEGNCRRLLSWRGQSKLSTYLVMIARNLTIDSLRKGGKEIAMETVPEKPITWNWVVPEEEREDENEKQRRLAVLPQALESIPAKQLSIMNLRLAGNSLREIAQLTGLPQGTVFVLNSRALVTLRQKINFLTQSTEDPEEVQQA